MCNLQFCLKNCFGLRIFTLHSIAALCFSFPVASQNKYKSPVIVPAGKPMVIIVPTRPGGFYNYTYSDGEVEKIILSPAKKSPLAVLKDGKGEVVKDKDGNPFILGEGGISNFTNYTTDNGLALDVIISSCIDHFGNLWFGTSGGGVSRYDGKSFTNFTTFQGLANNSVWSIIEDKKGNIWFGTTVGVSKYDGKSFTNYTTQQGLVNNTVWNICEDKDGNLWFGTGGGGVSRYDGKSFTNFTVAQGLINNFICCCCADKSGNIWFGTYDGMSRYDGKSFTKITMAQGLPANSVWSCIEDKKGNMWFGTDGGGVSCYNGKSFTNYSRLQGIANNRVWKIFEDKKGNIWLGTGGGVSRFDGKSFTSYTKSQGLAGNVVSNIVEDKTGNIWFGSDDNGLSRYDGKAFTNFSVEKGLANNTIWSILEDKTGKIWFGTNSGGLSCYDEKSFTNYTTNQGLADNTIWSILEDKIGNLWFGTYGGVSRYDGNRVEAIEAAGQRGEIIPQQTQQDLKKINGKLVKTFTNYSTSQGLINNTVLAILEDKSGNLWFGTESGGVSRYDGKSFANYTTEQGLASNSLRTIMEDKSGNIWFGTYLGISKYDPSVKRKTGSEAFTNYTTEQGLVNNTVLSILEDRTGNLWFGTDGGLSRYDGKSFLNFTKLHGLGDNVITQMTVGTSPTLTNEKNDYLILGTNFGLSILTGWKDKNGKFFPGMYPDEGDNLKEASNERLKNYTPVFEIYNSSTGYPVKDVNVGQNAIYKDSKGIIWIGTGAAKTSLTRFDPSALNHNPDPPVVVIQSVKINEENMCWNNLAQKNELSWKKKKSGAAANSLLTGNDSLSIPPNITEEVTTFGRTLSETERDTMAEKFSDIKFDGISPFYPLPENLILPFNHNNITFDFVAIEPARPYLVRYQYILDGYSDEWSPLTNKTIATFGNIHEGNYTFRLKALSPEGIWSQPVIYTFEVLPPIYRTWWAYTIYLIAVSSLLFSFYRWRTTSLRRDKEILEKTVEERTSEVVKQNVELEKLSIVASETDNGVLICGPNGEIEWSNDGLTRLLGYSFEELKQKGNTIEELSSNPDIKHIIHQSIENKQTSTYQVLNITKKGEERWTQSTLTPILDESGNIKKLVVIDTDISERIKIEKKLSKQNLELEQSHKDISILSEIGKEITSSLSVEKITEKTYENVNRLMEASVFFIGIYDAEKNQLFFPGAMEKGEKLPVFFNNLDDKNRPAVWCFKNQAEIIMNNVHEEYTFYFPNTAVPKPLAGETPESLVYIPISIQDKKIGVISVQSFNKNAYTNYHISIVRNLAVYVAIAIENAQLYENLEEKVEERTAELVKKKEEIEKTYNNIQVLSEIGQEITSTLNLEKVLDTVYEKVNSLMDATIFGIGTYHPERNCIEYQLAIEKGKKYGVYTRDMSNKNQFPVWCIENRQPVFINNVYEDYRKYIETYEDQIKKLEDGTYETGKALSMIYLPIQLEEKIIGIIAVQSPNENAYTQHDQEILQTLASYIAIALDNARLYDNMEAEIKSRTKEIEKQKQLLEEKNLKITDSINYAQRIQQAILPSQKMINSILPDSFVFFRPKDIVSGDFYWAHAIDRHQILFAAVDCTGHGVPGAFMSIMGYNLLEQIVKENKIYQPALILDELSKLVVGSLKQTDEVGSIKEGMDIALCSINYKTFELEYAGAHNSLNLIRKGMLTETKANQRSIGLASANSLPFYNHKIKLEKGDCFYIFSDGYADQFGGNGHQKFFYQPFRDLLVSIHQLSMEKQQQELEKVIVEWKGKREQTDDILIIGVRV